MDSTKTEQVVAVKLEHSVLANELANRYAGIEPFVAVGLIDADGNFKMSDEELKKRGCVFMTLQVNRKMDKSNMLVKDRETKESNPYIGQAWERYRVRIMTNCIWQNVVDNQRERTDGSETGWQADKKRANRIENFRNCRAVGHKEKNGQTTFYINYVVREYLTKLTYVDKAGRELDKADVTRFVKRPSKISLQREADKHGIAVIHDPKNRNMKMANIQVIRVFKRAFLPFIPAQTTSPVAV